MGATGSRHGTGAGIGLAILAVALLVRAAVAGEGDRPPDGAAAGAVLERLDALEAENQRLRARVDELEARDRLAGDDGDALAAMMERVPAADPATGLRISGMAAARFSVTGRDGPAPTGEFRVPEARLFFDAAISERIFAFLEIEMERHDSSSLKTGELYIAVEDVLRGLDLGGVLNLKAGRFDLPFGEEYLERDADRNPLITHSVVDVWGRDEGLMAYGRVGPIGYVVAVTNGGTERNVDFGTGKSVTAKVSANPLPWLRLSASFSDSGDVEWPEEQWAMYVSDAWSQPAGYGATSFRARMAELDVEVTSGPARVRGVAGWFELEDDDPAPGTDVRMHWFVLEGVADLAEELWAAARFSWLEADRAPYYLGAGNPELTYSATGRRVWRLSLGLGWRLSEHAFLKGEYARFSGETTTGDRDDEDLLAVEIVVRF